MIYVNYDVNISIFNNLYNIGKYIYTQFILKQAIYIF